jgi:DNA-binding transcriptional LysR family regulator
MTRVLPDLDALDLLVRVASTGSIWRTATERGLSQPHVSRRMSALERSLGVPLLTRCRRGTTLTPAGRVVVDWAASLLGAADDFTRSVRTLREGRPAGISVAVSMTIAEHYAPAWLARLPARSPEVRVSLSLRNSTEVAELVEAGEADVGFVESPTVRRSLQRRRIGWDQLAVAVAPSHPWATRRRPLSPTDLAAADLLVREPGSGTRETLERALQRAGLDLDGGLAMASNTALKSAAAAGLGAVVLSRLALAAELATRELVEVGVEDLALRRPLSAVWRREEPLTPGAALLVQVAAEDQPRA